MIIKINLLPKKKTVFKTINAFSLVLLILNMSLGGVLVTLNPVNACHANIKIIKNDISDSGVEFNFEIKKKNFTDSESFILSDDGENLASSTTSFYKGSGTYIITEEEKTNWNLENINCTSSTGFNPNFSYDYASNSVEIEYNSGDGDIECTFTNKSIVTRIDCPLTATGNQILVDFEEPLRSDRPENENKHQEGVNTSIPAGKYKVTLVAWDGYATRKSTQPQLHEQYKILLKNNSNEVIATSHKTTDLEDRVMSASTIDMVNGSSNPLIVNEATNKVFSFHANFPDTTSPNSVTPICALFDPIVEIIEVGSIKIIKDDISDSGEEFVFTTTNLTPSPFSLSDNGTNSVSSTTFSNLSAGTYAIAETAKIGWNLDSISCRSEGTNGASTTATIVNTNGLAGKVEIELYGNDINTICTFTNSPKGSITACKYIDEDGDSQTNDISLATTTPWTFILDYGTATTSLTADSSGCAVFNNLDLGNYTVSEIEKTGWTAFSATSSNINITSENLNETVNFVNYKEIETITGSIEVCKYIDDDGLASTTNDRYLSTTTPWKFILDNGTGTTTATTTESGCTTFRNLNSGNYDIFEIQKQYWQALSPLNGETSTVLQTGEDKIINFVNYYTKPYCGDGNINEELGEVCDLGAGYNGIPCAPAYGGTCSYCSNICKSTELTGPYCGDGVKDDNEECDGGNNCNSLCKKTGGGGGGGGSTIALKISDEKIYCFGEESVRITWRTNYYKESVIFYGEQSQKNAGTPPNYGYASSTKKTTEKATFHSVVVNDIKDNTYYFRPMSGNVKGKELSVDMTECRPEVKGEEGFPILTINKTIDTEFINPGDKNIKYTILVSNTGNLDAFNVVLTDSLPDGLIFASSTDIIKTWNFGDMAPGENKTIAYLVDSSKEIKEGVYINVAEVEASNHDKVSDSASLEVKEVKVLAATGFSINEFIAISFSAFLLFGVSFSLKKIQL